MLEPASVLTCTQQYGHDICITSYSWLHTNVRKLSQNTFKKMHHPVCEIWLAHNGGSSRPLTLQHHLILILKWPPLRAASKHPSRFVMQSCTSCILLLSTGRLAFVYKAKKTCLLTCLKISQNTLGHIHRIVHGAIVTYSIYPSQTRKFSETLSDCTSLHWVSFQWRGARQQNKVSFGIDSNDNLEL